MRVRALPLMALVGMVCTASAQEALLENPGFERGEIGDLPGWPVQFGAGECAIDPEVAHSGDRSLRLTNGGGVRSAPVRLKRTTVTVSGWIRTEDVVRGEQTYHQAALQLISLNEAGEPIGHSDIAMVTGTTGWTHYSAARVLSGAVHSVAVQCLLWGAQTTGTAWFDDLSLSLSGEPATPPLSDEELASATVTVDVNEDLGPFRHLWIGSDVGPMDRMATEAQLGAIDYANDYGFRYVRAHSCVHNPKIYSEDEAGKPVYDWAEFDRRIDAVVELGMWPVICLEGTPPEIATEDAGQGWRNPHPPRGEEGYLRWQQICREIVAHCIDRYGDAVHNWLFEVWNEPNASGYFAGTLEEYLRIYDHAVEGATSADPEIVIGGPASAGTGWIRELLEHCSTGTNDATGETGTRIDFLSWHVYTVGVGVPSFEKLRQHGAKPLAILRDFPQYADLPTIITEWGCSSAPRHFHDRPYNAAFRVLGVQTFMDMGITLAMPFNYGSGPPHAHEGFQGNHAMFAKTIVPKPQFRAFELMARMVGERVACESDGPPVGGIACLADGGETLWVMLYSVIEDYQRDAYETAVALQVDGLDLADCVARQWRIAPGECDPYLAWEQMGKPEELTDAQQRTLLEASEIPPAETLTPEGGNLRFTMPGSSAALIEINRRAAE